MKKKFLAIIALAATLVFSCVLLAGCAGGDKPDVDKPSSEGAFTLAVGFDQGYPPYGYVGDDGKFTGFDLDLAKAVCDKNGWDLKLEAIDWDAKDALMGSGAINCIWNGFTMEGREDQYTFSEPYMYNEQVIVVKADSDIKTEKDLSGKTVITQVDSAALDVLENDKADFKNTFKSLGTIDNYNNAFMQLESGQVDAVACDLSIAGYQMAAKPNAYMKLSVLSTENYAVGFKLGNDKLAKQVSETLKQLDDDGTVKKLCDKYADQGIVYDNWTL